MRNPVFAELRPAGGARAGRVDPRGPPAGALPGPVAQDPVGRGKRPMKAVVMVSGGLDSATVLAMARAQGRECHALSFDYGQRHRAELAAAARIAKQLGAAEHRVV